MTAASLSAEPDLTDPPISYRPRRLRRSRPPEAPTLAGEGHRTDGRHTRYHASGVADSAPRPARPHARNPFVAAGTQLSLALACWAALLLLVYATDPDDALPRAGFFLLLFGALFFTLAPLLRTVSRKYARSRLYQQAVGIHATRQALMLAAFVVLNALLQMVRAWSGFNAALLLGMFAVIEIVALARR